jgi:hypothetical protein
MSTQWMIPFFPALTAALLILWTIITKQRWMPTIVAVSALLVVGITLTAFAQM